MQGVVRRDIRVDEFVKRSYQEESLIRNTASVASLLTASTACQALLGRWHQLSRQPALDTARSAIPFGPRMLHFAHDGRIDD